MQYNISFDIAAMLNLILILFIYGKKVKIHSFENNILLFMICDCMIATVFEILSSIAISYPHSFPLAVMNFLCWAFFISNISIPFLYAYYNIMITDAQKSMHLFQKIIFCLPEIICIIITFYNPFTHHLFYFDKNLNYCHGTGLYLYYLTAFYYLLIAIIHSFQNRKHLEKNTLYSLYTFNIIALIVAAVQISHPELLLELFSASLCLLIMLINIQNPGKLINSQTELLNRDAMASIIEQKFYHAENFTIISLKLKDLPFFNKTLGSAYVNSMIKNVSVFLKSLCNKHTRIFHIGFGQFCFVFPSLNENEVTSIVQTLQQRFSLPWNTDDIDVDLGFLLGIGHAPEDFSDYESLCDFIDYRPDRDNLSERGHYSSEKFHIIYAKDTLLHLKQRIKNVEHAIQRALRDGNFQVYYQPIYSVKEKKFTCAEALIRLWDREYGMISPEEFIPIAEKNGTILDIGLFVFETVCKCIAKDHLTALGVEYIEVNLSVVQCMQPKLAEQLLSIMKQYNVRPEQINLEITETAAAVSPETLKLNMMNLSEQNICFSLDDYGTGYSTMSYALDLPFSYVKLDKSIVASASSDDNTHIALCSTIQMMKQLHFLLIAEGVDNEEQLDFLIKNGCDYIQGYYFSKPLPKDGYLEFLQKYNF